MRIGPTKIGEQAYAFVVWAPNAEKVVLQLDNHQRAQHPLTPLNRGYWQAAVPEVSAGVRYSFILDDGPLRADPASHYQPCDVHGPSELVDHDSFAWTDAGYIRPSLGKSIIYEFHVGTFTPQGTLDSAADKLDHLQELGVTVMEIMPVAQFPGSRNWGYDGTYPFAVQRSYGGPQAMKRFVDACHSRGMAVVLDVVYNHLGPEGNYLHDFGPYFTTRHRTAWGDALNFDGAYSDEVRNFFMENARHWFENYHVDGLRLDATHAIDDRRPVHFLAELAQVAQEHGERTGRRPWVISESDRNDPRLVMPDAVGGYGHDAMWSDDLHHALHSLLTGERQGYYQDYGQVAHLVKALRQGFVYQGGYSRYRRHSHGAPTRSMPARAHVVCSQNHDQIGNRMLGERLSSLVSPAALRMAAGLLLLSPYTPLLFMGEEYGETAPFLYFISHLDAGLVKAVCRGRKRDFKEFAWKGTPPDPASEATYARSRLDWDKLEQSPHKELFAFYKALIRLRHSLEYRNGPYDPQPQVQLHAAGEILLMEPALRTGRTIVLCNLAEHPVLIQPAGLLRGTCWNKVLDSSDSVWTGSGCVLPERVTAGTSAGCSMPGCSLAAFAADSTTQCSTGSDT